MLNFVRRLRERRQTETWNRGVVDFSSLLNDGLLLGHARPLILPQLMRVTAQKPYIGPYLEDDMTLARQPDGRPLETYMIDGFAIDGLWLGFDALECELYLTLTMSGSSPRLLHPAQSLPVYEFTPAMAEILQRASPTGERYHMYVYCVEHDSGYVPLTRDGFAERYRWDLPKVIARSALSDTPPTPSPLRLAA